MNYKDMQGKYMICSGVGFSPKDKREVFQLGKLRLRRKWILWGEREYVLELKYMTGTYRGITIKYVIGIGAYRKEPVWEVRGTKDGKKRFGTGCFGLWTEDDIYDDLSIAAVRL